MAFLFVSFVGFSQNHYKLSNSNVERKIVKTNIEKSAKELEVVFSEDFESYEAGHIFDGTVWTNHDVDGDNNKWFAFATTNYTKVATSASWVSPNPVTPNNFLVSPAIDLTNYSGEVSLVWRAFAQDPDWVEEHYKVVVSTTDNLATSFPDENIVFEETLPGADIYERSADLSAYAGEVIYIAFVHYNSTDWFRLNIDNIIVSAEPTVIPTYTVTFTVTDGTDPIEGATIAVAGEELTTDASGVATIDLEDGEYPYTVTKEGFVAFEGTATVAGEALAVAVEMEAEVVTFPVTFTVIDQKEIYTNIKFKGTPTSWATVAMVEDPAHTWTVTLDVEPGSHEWGAIEDDGSEWGIWLIEGSNPAFTVAADGTVTGQTSYTILPAGDKSVTFILDITGLEGFDPAEDFIDIAGDFTGWSGTDPLEVDPENSNIYTITAGGELRPGQTIKFKFRKNGDWDLAETPADPDGKMNRVFVVSAEDEENVYHAVWGENYTHNLGEVAAIADINVANGTAVEDLNLPAMVTVTLGAPGNLTDVTVDLPVTWNTDNYDGSVAGQVVLEGEITLVYEDVTYFNGHELKASVTVNVATNINTNATFQFSMFPNPTSGDLNIAAGTSISSIRVFNMLGQQVIGVSNLGRESLVLPTTQLSAGIYIISATDANGNTVSSRFIKK